MTKPSMTKNNNNREVRGLSNLSDTAATSRVINFAQTFQTNGTEEDYRNNPFFKDGLLNKSLIIKHTLRTNERDLFARSRRTATKIILPFDPSDLKLGGRSVFVNQIGFDEFCRDYFSTKNLESNSDIQTLRLIDGLPSLDPFLVREHLSRHGIKPAACYLKISTADISSMTGYANEEVAKLVSQALGGGFANVAIRLTGKILSNEMDNELEPLQMTLKMTPEEFSEGIFSWRGFLYFKWRNKQLQDDMRKVLEGLASYQPLGVADSVTKDYLKEVRPRLARKIVMAIANVGRTLSVYDQAYHALVECENPGPFRRFLLDGPSMFFQLGENIGILSHIGSFWAYAIGRHTIRDRLAPHEYADVLIDFEDSLANLPDKLDTRAVA